jgi:hypothetical protein
MIIKNQIVLSLNQVGKNGHTFQYEFLENAIEDAIAKSNKSSLFGELFIGNSKQINVDETINFSNVSHLIKNLRYDSKAKTLIGDIEVLGSTEAGRTLKSILRSKDETVRLSFSQRADSIEGDSNTVHSIIAYDIIEFASAATSTTELNRNNITQKEI